MFYAAVFRAFDMAKTRMKEAISSMQKGQLVLLGKTDPWVSQFHRDNTNIHKHSIQHTDSKHMYLNNTDSVYSSIFSNGGDLKEP